MLRVKDGNKKRAPKNRRPYQKPHLYAYGIVKELTAGGTGTVFETKGYSKTDKITYP
jgi:hypothetical protein